MALILHYTQIVGGTKEYIVLTEDEKTPELIEEHRMNGYELDESYEIDGDLGRLPTDRELFPS